MKHQDGTACRTASGVIVEDGGTSTLSGRDKDGKTSGVDKILVAGSAAAKCQHAWITKGEESLIPHRHPIARCMHSKWRSRSAKTAAECSLGCTRRMASTACPLKRAPTEETKMGRKK